jgi:3-oxoacyl-[acyl-carrier-protein] synthase II
MYVPTVFYETRTALDADLSKEDRKMARFAQFAMAATEEALEDAAWRPTSDEQREATVCSSS